MIPTHEDITSLDMPIKKPDSLCVCVVKSDGWQKYLRDKLRMNRTSTSIFYKTPSNTKLNQFLLKLTFNTFTLRRKWQESISFIFHIMKACYLMYEAVQIVIVSHHHRCPGNESQVMSLKKNESNCYHPTPKDRKCHSNLGTGGKKKKSQHADTANNLPIFSLGQHFDVF